MRVWAAAAGGDAEVVRVPSDEISEEAPWLVRAKAGDQAAFGWLIARYRERAVRLAAHILRRPGEAEDAAQEAFIRAFRSLSAFRGEGRFYTWLYAIVLRVCLDRRRLARWHRERAAEENLPPSSASEAAPAETEIRLQVECLLDRLSPPMRAALVLREIEGLEYAEIARVLSIPVGTVRSRLNAARAQFRALWSEAMHEADRV